MKYLLILSLILLLDAAFSQTKFPDFLDGTWKVENQEFYEHWDLLNTNRLKGFSYSLEMGQMEVIEYFDITRKKGKIRLTASVLDQNEGNPIDFRLTRSDSIIAFENPRHDFPKLIEYKKTGEDQIRVRISDGKDREFTYTQHRQVQPKTEIDSTISNPNYDAALASQLGADDYGMKSFVLVILKTGPNKTTDRELINQSFRGHLDNINRLVEDGKLIVAGPMAKNDQTYRGIFILNAASIEEAEDLLQTDPAIQAGLLDTELFTWYGSAALSTYLEYSDKVWKKQP